MSKLVKFTIQVVLGFNTIFVLLVSELKLSTRASGEALCPGLISTIMQNFTLVGVTVAEIYVTGQINAYIQVL